MAAAAAQLRRVIARSAAAAAEGRGLATSAGMARGLATSAGMARGLVPSTGDVARPGSFSQRRRAAWFLSQRRRAAWLLSHRRRAAWLLSHDAARLAPFALQFRSLSSTAEENGSENGEKEMKMIFEFVRDLKEIFTVGTSIEELAAYKTLTVSLGKMEERHKLLNTCFLLCVAFGLSVLFTFTYVLTKQDTKVSDLSQAKKGLEDDIKNIEKRMIELSYAVAFAEKYGKLPAPQISPAPGNPSKG